MSKNKTISITFITLGVLIMFSTIVASGILNPKKETENRPVNNFSRNFTSIDPQMVNAEFCSTEIDLKKPTKARDNMLNLYSCSIKNHLDLYKRIPDLENPQSIQEVLQDIKFLREEQRLKAETEVDVKPETDLFTYKIYESDYFAIDLYSPRDNYKPRLENYIMHHEHNPLKMDIDKMLIDRDENMAPSMPMVLRDKYKNQNYLVISTHLGFQIMTPEHLYRIVGFENKEHQVNYVLLYHKLFDLNKAIPPEGDYFNGKLEGISPLIFLSKYNFNNSRDRSEPYSRCTSDYQANLETKFTRPNSITYFAHGNGEFKNTIDKIVLSRTNDKFTVKKTAELKCNSMIEC